MRTPLRVVPWTLIALIGCGGGRDPRTAPLTNPSELAGRWVRQLTDSTWGDTLFFLPDGSVKGSVKNPVPPSARWGVRADRSFQSLCVGDSRESACNSYQLQNGVLTWDLGPQGKDVFRRVP
jgi:hypothetical protein